ncbi:MAG TPA: FHA domain-containing protein [Phycisphaerae bacterium]|nr:FHA domain-containing protein [Phycisphaerae bacterium]HDZ42652.1 FHA domain-containing protein [Phycisphaerae bacterium]
MGAIMQNDMPIDVTQFIQSPQLGEGEGDLPRLLAVTGPLVGASFVIATETATIGRDATNSIQLSAAGVSRQHCTIIREQDGGLSIVDEHSTNGTIVNGRRLKGAASRRLHHGDTIEICESTFFFLNAQAAAAAAEAEISIDLGAASKEAHSFLKDCSDILSLSKARRKK